MSSPDGQKELLSANFLPTKLNSARSSLLTEATSISGLTSLDSPTTQDATVNGNHSEGLVTESIVSVSDLCQQGLNHLEDTQNGRQWLSHLDQYHENPEISVHLGANGIATSDEPQSLLPLFAKLIPSWYALTQHKRRAEKHPRNGLLQEQDDLLWLLEYVAEYLCAKHSSFPDTELSQVCLSLTDICQKTSRADDINASIKILYNVMKCSTFPKDALGGAMEVFCAATIILPEPHDTLTACIKLLLTGSIGQQAVECMLDFATAPTIQNNSHNLSYARGAMRQLRANIDLSSSNGTLVFDLPHVLDTLHQVSKCCIFRLCTEVLAVCNSILRSEQISDLLATDLRRFMDTVQNCIRTTIARSTSTRSLLSLRSPDREGIFETERQNNRYLAERKVTLRSLLSGFESVWPDLPAEQRDMVCDLFVEHIKDLNDTQTSVTLSHVKSQGSFPTDTEDWGLRLIKVHDNFVRNPKVSNHNRLLAVELCVAAATYAVLGSDNFSIGSHNAVMAAGYNVVDRLLNLTGHEPTTSVVKGILSSLVDLAFCTNGHDRYPYAELIVRKLLWSIKNERDSGEDVYDEHVLLSTNTLQRMFIRSLTSGAIIAPRAYDALVEIADPSTRSRRCRLAALRVLTRLRCDAAGMIYLQVESDSQYIASALCRTQESREAFANESASSQTQSTNALGQANSFNSRQLWSYPEEIEFMQGLVATSSHLVLVRGFIDVVAPEQAQLQISNWLIKVIECLQADSDWETFSFLIVHLGAQLFNTKLFSTSLEALVKLRQVVCTQIINEKFKEPPSSTGLRKSDTALCMFNMLTSLIPYATMKSENIQKGFGDDLVRAFLTGIGNSWEGTARGCIHALCVCGFEIPASVASLYPNILTKMSRSMTQSHLTIHILEFLTQVARLPDIHSNFTQDEITMIFGISVQFLEKARELHSTLSAPSPRSGTPARHSGLTLKKPPYRAAMLQDIGLPQYASALAYDTMIFWFLSLRLDVRAKYVSWIVPRLIWKNSHGEDTIDEQSQVFIDMMQRTAYSDLGETRSGIGFAQEADGAISSASWMIGLSIVTVETAGHTGVSQITKRQASGTTHAIYRQLTAPLPAHHVPSHTEILPAEDSRYGATEMLPPHILLQMVTTAAPTSADDQPIALPQEDFVTRALNIFDKMPTVDSHKLGVVYIAPGQRKDTDFLANTAGSSDFEDFLAGLGYKVGLEPPLAFNPQGLQYPRDGKSTIAWRDRITEIIFHVPTMMPNNLEDDPTCNMKKAHVGNCHVMIVFNESGLPWSTENFPSAVTFVHVVITPANRPVTVPVPGSDTPLGKPKEANQTVPDPTDFYDVHVLTKENYPNVSPAADPKVISREQLPEFVRMFALNANVFSQAKVADDNNDNEFPSNWRARLQAIKTLKQRVIERSGVSHGHSGNGANLVSTAGGRRTPSTRESPQSTERDENEGALALQLDFGKWTQ